METQNQTGLGMAVVKSGEMAISALAAQSKAMVEAKFVIALKNPRNIQQARVSILDACKRPGFAESARYAKPVGGGKTTSGFSIRFAETAIQAMRNITVAETVTYEDDDRRTVRVDVTDLESNLSYGKDITVTKTVERRQLKQGQKPRGERLNSYGDKVFIVEATEDEVAIKVAAQVSKIIRNCGLRLIPADILEEAEEQIVNTLEKGGGDPKAETKKVCDAFATIGIEPKDIERYLKHTIATISPKELVDLRAIYRTIKDGEAAWSDYVGFDESKTAEGNAKPLFSKKAAAPAPAATPVSNPDEAEEAAAGLAPNPGAPENPPTQTQSTAAQEEEGSVLQFLRQRMAESNAKEADVIQWLVVNKKVTEGSVTSLADLAEKFPTVLNFAVNKWATIARATIARAVGN